MNGANEGEPIVSLTGFNSYTIRGSKIWSRNSVSNHNVNSIPCTCMYIGTCTLYWKNGSLVLTKNLSQRNTHRFSPSWAFIRCVSSTHTRSIRHPSTCSTSDLHAPEGIACTCSHTCTNLSTGICMCLTGNGRLACTHRLCRDEIFRLCRVLPVFEGSRIQAGATKVGLRESCEGCVCVCVCVCVTYMTL